MKDLTAHYPIIPDRTGETTTYIVWLDQQRSTRLKWSQMTNLQKRQQLEAEQRQYEIDLFNPCGLD